MNINFNALNEPREENEAETKFPAIHDPFDPAPLLNLFNKFHKEIDLMESKADKHEVKDQQSNNDAVEMTTQSKKIAQTIERKRKAAKKPYLKVTDTLDGEVKRLRDRLSVVQTKLNNKIKPYLQEQERIKQEKEAKARRKAAEEQAKIRKQLEKEAKEKAEAEQAKLDKEFGGSAPIIEVKKVIVPEVVAPIMPELKTETNAGTAKLNIKKDWEIIDFKELPDIIFEKRKTEIIKAIKPQVNAMIKSGLTNIPGVRVFEVTELKTRTTRG